MLLGGSGHGVGAEGTKGRQGQLSCSMSLSSVTEVSDFFGHVKPG